MIPILSAQQIREADQFTIANEPIQSIDLMERASVAFVEELVKRVIITGEVFVFCGVGNNGGDGLAISRLLRARELPVKTYVIGDIERGSADFKVNYQRLEGHVDSLGDSEQLPEIHPNDLIIDALLGSGLSRPVEGLASDVIIKLNASAAKKVSVDIASGLYADTVPTEGATIFQPDITISFQVPKWSFFQPSLSQFVGDFYIADIGLDQQFVESQKTENYFTAAKDIRGLFHKRSRFSHKGDFGRLLIIAGSYGKMGAAVMCAQAAFRSGAGLVFIASPKFGVEVLQNQVKEAMVIPCGEGEFIDSLPDLSEFDVIAIGPGIGLEKETFNVIEKLMKEIQGHQQLVMDADAINGLSKSKELFERLPKQTILTPHPGEFKRMVGAWTDDADKLNRLKDFAKNYNANIVLKGAYSAVVDHEGTVHYNPSGNPGMATAGSGDVLTGVIAGLLSSGLSSINALIAGVYVHGVAGDLSAEKFGERSLTAGDLISMLPKAFKEFE